MRRSTLLFLGSVLLGVHTSAGAFFLDHKPFDEPLQTTLWIDAYRSAFRVRGESAIKEKAEAGDARAAYLLLTLKLNRRWRDSAEGLEEITAVRAQLSSFAEQGIIEARYLLGTTFLDCSAEQACRDRAVQEFSTAAEHGFPPALGALGALSWSPSSTPSELSDAVQILEDGVRAGSPVAMTNLAMLLSLKDGVVSDPLLSARTRALIESAADSGEPIAAVYLSDEIERDGGSPELQLAILRRAAASRSSTAEGRLGRFFLKHPDLRDPRTDPSAIDLLRSACTYGSADVCVLAATQILAFGAPDERQQQARSLLQIGIEAGLPEAHAAFAQELRPGGRLKVDLALAAYHTRMAADLGHLASTFNAGLMFLKGDGVEINVDEARRYLQRAASLGHEGAKRVLDDLAAR